LRARGRLGLDLQQRLDVPQLASILVQTLRLVEKLLHLPHPTLVRVRGRGRVRLRLRLRLRTGVGVGVRVRARVRLRVRVTWCISK
tara:strand:+ start:350 stop:607 length:258 start_codon:yes stop_codon:yes gene_type:complete